MEKEIISFAKKGIPINISSFKMHQDEAYRGMHSHSAIEIVIVKSGILICSLPDEEIYINPKEIILINSNIAHRLHSRDDDIEISYLQIDIGFFKENNYNDEFSALYSFISHSTAKPYMIFKNNEELGKIVAKIYARYYEEEECSLLYLKAYIYELIAFMNKCGFLLEQNIETQKLQKIEDIVCFINENFKTPITLDDICNKVPYSRFTLCRTFKAATGRAIFDYINFLRINYAVEKLKQKNHTILEIATECGFSSVTYFNRVFKSIMGCAPSVYKKYF